MAALISVLVAITLSLLVTRIATEALTLTGLSRPSASFQARSAFTGAGFTTAESESVVDHPVRRRIIMWLMFLGNAGIITVISSLILTFVSPTSTGDWLFRFAILFIGVGILWILSVNRAFNRLLTRWVRWSLRRWTDLDVRDYAGLLHLRGKYRVMEIEVEAEDWLANKELKALRLRDEGIMVLGIKRSDGSYIGAPHGETYICPGDLLIMYGRRAALMELDVRHEGIAGNQAHQDAIAAQQQIENEQDLQDYYSHEARSTSHKT